MKYLIVLVITLLLSGCGFEQPEDSLLRVCPDAWIDNQQPCACDTPPCNCGGEYYVVNGERKETEVFDQEWVEQNCNLEKQVVY